MRGLAVGVGTRDTRGWGVGLERGDEVDSKHGAGCRGVGLCRARARCRHTQRGKASYVVKWRTGEQTKYRRGAGVVGGGKKARMGKRENA